jgi:hypothetical protein
VLRTLALLGTLVMAAVMVASYFTPSPAPRPAPVVVIQPSPPVVTVNVTTNPATPYRAPVYYPPEMAGKMVGVLSDGMGIHEAVEPSWAEKAPKPVPCKLSKAAKARLKKLAAAKSKEDRAFDKWLGIENLEQDIECEVARIGPQAE